jgi:hypothetical protein
MLVVRPLPLLHGRRADSPVLIVAAAIDDDRIFQPFQFIPAGAPSILADHNGIALHGRPLSQASFGLL